MRHRIDIHGMADRYAAATCMIKKDKELSEYNRKTIMKFCYDLQTEGISITRQVKYLHILPPIAKLLRKDFNKANVDDIKRVVQAEKKLMARWRPLIRSHVSSCVVHSETISHLEDALTIRAYQSCWFRRESIREVLLEG